MKEASSDPAAAAETWYRLWVALVSEEASASMESCHCYFSILCWWETHTACEAQCNKTKLS